MDVRVSVPGQEDRFVSLARSVRCGVVCVRRAFGGRGGKELDGPAGHCGFLLE